MKVLQSGRVKAFAFLAIGIGGGLLAAGPLSPGFATAFAGQQGVQPHVIFTENSGQAALKAINNGSGYAIVGQAISSAGMFGQSISGGGVVGVSTSGYGATGTSLSNIGLNGTSSTNSGVAGSTHADFPFAGVTGISLSPDGNATGIYGSVGATGIGITGTCNTGDSGNCVGMLAETAGTNGIALDVIGFNGAPNEGYIPAPAFIVDTENGGPAMQVDVDFGAALSVDGAGQTTLNALGNESTLIALSNGSPPKDIANAAIEALTSGIGGDAILGGQNGIGADVEGFSGSPALEADTLGGGPAMLATSSGCDCDIMSLDNAGNLNITGILTQGGAQLTRTKTVTGHPVDTYSAQQSEPTVEDFGQGQLVNGQASVRIDPAFGNTMDQRASYLVFITPDGDSRGLYTTQKSSSGFIVRENGGGRSTLAFDYRIVGKPFGNSSARLPAAQGQIPIAAAGRLDIQHVRAVQQHPKLRPAYRAKRLPFLVKRHN